MQSGRTLGFLFLLLVLSVVNAFAAVGVTVHPARAPLTRSRYDSAFPAAARIPYND